LHPHLDLCQGLDYCHPSSANHPVHSRWKQQTKGGGRIKIDMILVMKVEGGEEEIRVALAVSVRTWGRFCITQFLGEIKCHK
jgi:hypothetical protein